MSEISQNDAIDTADMVDAINSTTRKLATVQVIQELRPIPGADRIVVAIMEGLGWECVVKKDEFKVGDKVIYIEVDSKVPERPEFEFLRERKFKIKTIKLRKQISEGLIIPLSTLPLETEQFCGNALVTWNTMEADKAPDAKKIPIEVGMDVSSIIGVYKYDPEGKAERALIVAEKRSPVMRFMMNIPAFRYVYLKLNEKKGPWPEWIARTDETRIQVCAKHIMNHYDEEWEITEKLDGQSATFFLHPMKKWGFRIPTFGVCSRKIWLKTPTDSRYWQVAKKLDLEAKLRKENEWYKKRQISEKKNASLVVQGEQCGPGIQGNKYQLSEIDLYVFNVIANGIRYRYDLMLDFCKDHGLKAVPLVNGSFIPSRDIGPNKSVIEVVQFMVTLSQGNSLLLARPREGIVCRLKSDPNVSLKVINPYFKMEQEKEEDNAEE
jgi:hypothetical protein